MRISDWSSDVCSSDLVHTHRKIVPETGLARRRAHACSAARPAGRPARADRLALAGGAWRRGPFPRVRRFQGRAPACRSEEHTSELQSLMRISYAVFCLKKKKNKNYERNQKQIQKHQVHTLQRQTGK